MLLLQAVAIPRVSFRHPVLHNHAINLDKYAFQIVAARL